MMSSSAPSCASDDALPIPRVAIFPFVSKGHTIPLVHLARLLHRRRLAAVTFLATPLNAPFVRRSLAPAEAAIVELPTSRPGASTAPTNSPPRPSSSTSSAPPPSSAPPSPNPSAAPLPPPSSSPTPSSSGPTPPPPSSASPASSSAAWAPSPPPRASPSPSTSPTPASPPGSSRSRFTPSRVSGSRGPISPAVRRPGPEGPPLGLHRGGWCRHADLPRHPGQHLLRAGAALRGPLDPRPRGPGLVRRTPLPGPRRRPRSGPVPPDGLARLPARRGPAGPVRGVRVPGAAASGPGGAARGRAGPVRAGLPLGGPARRTRVAAGRGAGAGGRGVGGPGADPGARERAGVRDALRVELGAGEPELRGAHADVADDGGAVPQRQVRRGRAARRTAAAAERRRRRDVGGGGGRREDGEGADSGETGKQAAARAEELKAMARQAMESGSGSSWTALATMIHDVCGSTEIQK
uniref:Uncharacterized protein n=1 Tax=Ananas comosus var. bracteatus TaxID=296719 RepID=A0A6V7P7K0_ANACO|nr:unnamed protein product [Ananas comosus var. bracteatus]